MLTWVDHAFFVVLAVLFPLRAATFGFRRLKLAALADRPRVRLVVYRQAVVLQWALFLVVAVLWLVHGRPWRSVGMVPEPSLGMLATSIVVVIAAAVFLRHRQRALASDDALAEARKRMQHLEVMLPHDAREARWFYRLSLTAGICEEVLYRGYLIWYFAHWTGVIPAAIAASLVFGLGHSYQGWRGVLSTSLFGAILSALYLVSGSLLVPVVVHILVDLHAGHLALRAYQRKAEMDAQRAAELQAQMAETHARDSGTRAERETEMADVIVVGLGAIGSAAADHLARRGLRVVGLDRFRPPHDRGSSHGQSRVIREAYFENPQYVPIVQRAYDLWGDLERETGRSLMKLTGGVMVGPPDGTLVQGALRSAQVHGLPHESLEAAAIRSRFPGYEPADHMVGVWEPRAGYLRPEACVEAQLARAERHGALLHYDEPALSWQVDGAGVAVETARARYRADRLVLAAGPWIGTLLEGLGLPFEVTRQPLFWYRPRRPDRFGDHAPIYVWEHERDRFFYGFPMLDGEMKVAFHVQGPRISPDEPRAEVQPGEADALTELLERYMPDVPGEWLRGVVCRYTNLPDGHFIVDLHPEHSQVAVASACSGHGFKFAPALGEALGDLLLTGASRYELSLFRLARFSS